MHSSHIQRHSHCQYIHHKMKSLRYHYVVFVAISFRRIARSTSKRKGREGNEACKMLCKLNEIAVV